MLCTNLIVTANQKPVIDIQKVKTKESDYIMKEKKINTSRKQDKKEIETYKTTINV